MRATFIDRLEKINRVFKGLAKVEEEHFALHPALDKSTDKSFKISDDYEFRKQLPQVFKYSPFRSV